MPEPAPEPPPAAPAEEPAQDEPVTFSFGGAKIAMKEEALKPAKSAAKIERAPDKRDAISSTQYAILSFVLIAAVLGAAFYFITR